MAAPCCVVNGINRFCNTSDQLFCCVLAVKLWQKTKLVCRLNPEG